MDKKANVGELFDELVASDREFIESGIGRRRVDPVPERKTCNPPNPDIEMLTRDFRDLFGKVPDGEIVEKSGCSLKIVKQVRRTLGIAPWAPSVNYTKKLKEDYRDKLGKVSDKEIALQLGCSDSVVSLVRRSLGIDRFDSERIKDSMINRAKTKYRHLLGTMSDLDLSIKIGCSPGSIGTARRSLGVKPFMPKGGKDIREFIPLLGTMTDYDLAKKAGVSAQRIFQTRKRLGIPRFNERGDVTAAVKKNYADDLGKIPDNLLAKWAGCSKTTVRNARRELGIPACRKPLLSAEEIAERAARNPLCTTTTKKAEKSAKERTAMLGAMTDKVSSSVIDPKLSRGPVEISVKVPWRLAKYLGKFEDFRFAKILGCPEREVAALREALGIAPCKS